jgi:flagellin-specific chaperone FliS
LLKGLNSKLKQETLLEMLFKKAIKTLEIEKEYMSRGNVMFSIKNNLGINQSPAVNYKRASGIVILMVEINHKTDKPLTWDLLCH